MDVSNESLVVLLVIFFVGFFFNYCAAESTTKATKETSRYVGSLRIVTALRRSSKAAPDVVLQC